MTEPDPKGPFTIRNARGQTAECHIVVLSPDDYDFIVKFDPDRDRSANRRELVEVIEYMQTVIVEGTL